MKKAIRVLYWALVVAGAGLASLGCGDGEAGAGTREPVTAKTTQPPLLVSVSSTTTLETGARQTRAAATALDAIEARLPATTTPKPTEPATPTPARSPTPPEPATPGTATPAAEQELTMAAEASTGFTVSRLVVATGVSEREPVGDATTFSTADTARLWAFVDIDNPSALPGKLQVTWLETATGRELHPYALEVQGHKRWRTWARAAAPKQPGAWEVIVRDEAGIELARAAFEMVN